MTSPPCAAASRNRFSSEIGIERSASARKRHVPRASSIPRLTVAPFRMGGTDEFDAIISPGHFRDDRRLLVDAAVINNDEFGIAAKSVEFFPDIVDSVEDRRRFVKGGYNDGQHRRAHRNVRVAPGQFLDFDPGSSYTCRAYVGARRGRGSSIGFMCPLIERSRSA